MTTRGALIRGVLTVTAAGITATSGALQSWSEVWTTKDWSLSALSIVGAIVIAARAFYDQSMGDAKKDAENAPDNPVPKEEKT